MAKGGGIHQELTRVLTSDRFSMGSDVGDAAGTPSSGRGETSPLRRHTSTSSVSSIASASSPVAPPLGASTDPTRRSVQGMIPGGLNSIIAQQAKAITEHKRTSASAAQPPHRPPPARPPPPSLPQLSENNGSVDKDAAARLSSGVMAMPNERPMSLSAAETSALARRDPTMGRTHHKSYPPAAAVPPPLPTSAPPPTLLKTTTPPAGKLMQSINPAPPRPVPTTLRASPPALPSAPPPALPTVPPPAVPPATASPPSNPLPVQPPPRTSSLSETDKVGDEIKEQQSQQHQQPPPPSTHHPDSPNLPRRSRVGSGGRISNDSAPEVPPKRGSRGRGSSSTSMQSDSSSMEGSTVVEVVGSYVTVPVEVGLQPIPGVENGNVLRLQLPIPPASPAADKKRLTCKEQFPPPTPVLIKGIEEATSKANALTEDDVPRDQWEALAMKRHPDVLELRERLRPLSRAESFGRLYAVGRTEVRETLSQDMVLQLVMQHLSMSGLTETMRALHDEAKVPFSVTDGSGRSKGGKVNESLLLNHLRMAVKDTERLYELALSDDKEDWEGAGAGGAVDAHLKDLGVYKGGADGDTHQNVNVWDEDNDESREETLLLHEVVENEETKTRLKGGTLNQLIANLAREKRTEGDNQFFKTCLLTYRSFTTPEKLLQKLIERYDGPPRESSRDWKRWQDNVDNFRVIVRSRVLNAIRRWVEASSFDFTEKLLQVLRDFVEKRVKLDGDFPSKGPSGPPTIPDTLLQKIAMVEKGQLQRQLVKSKTRPPEPIVPRNVCSPELLWKDVDEEEIARQLTLMDFENYSEIKPVELLQLAWSKRRYRAPNVLAMIERFNTVSMWVTVQIVSEARLRDRVKIFGKLIRIAEHLLRLGNFNMVMAIVAGLNRSSVHRLNHTKEELGSFKDELDKIEAILAPEKNMAAYRHALKRANPPCIPYLGVYLTDLTFIEEGNQDQIESASGTKLINVYKRSLVSNVILEVLMYQNLSYDFHAVPQIQLFFTEGARGPLFTVPGDDKAGNDRLEKVLYDRSLDIEPRSTDRADIAKITEETILQVNPDTEWHSFHRGPE